jgi:predicted RNA-binding protein with PIN domain
MGGDFDAPESAGNLSTLKGQVPASELGDYADVVASYTQGQGRLQIALRGYAPCHNPEAVIAAANYDPEADLENTPHSVFCDHGAGFVVPWNEVDSYKHLSPELSIFSGAERIIPKRSKLAKKFNLGNDELEEIMLREFGPIRRKSYGEPKLISGEKSKSEKTKKAKRLDAQKNLIIIDGYNVIYAWDSLKEIAEYSLEKARETLTDILSNYAAYTKTELVLVFDAYLVKDGHGSDFMHDGYRVVYTKEDQTADTFIEIMMHDLGPDYSVKVVTGDRLLQFSAVHSGILRMTAKEFEDDVTRVGNEITEFIRKLSENKN